MSSYADELGNKQSLNSTAPKQASVLSLIILVIVVFVLQTGMKEIMKWLTPQGNTLKLMVITQLLLTIFLPVCIVLIVLKLPVRQSLGLYPPPWIKTFLAVILGFVLIYAVNIILPV